MFDLLKGVVEGWNAIPNEEKKLILMWLTTLVLGFVSIGVGIFQGDVLLILAGIASIGYALSMLVLFGLALVALVIWLIVSILKLPVLLIRSLLARRKPGGSSEKESGEGGSTEDQADLEASIAEIESKGGWSSAVIVIVWFALVFSQAYLLLQYLE